MKCIYCDTNNTYRDRRNGTCKKCGKKFAFEPKTLYLPLVPTDKAFLSAIERVSENGSLFFTARQLYYQLIRRTGKAPITYNDFRSTLLPRWVDAHGRPEKLLSQEKKGPPQGKETPQQDIQQYSFDRLLVVDKAETAHMLVSNNLHFETSTPIISVDGYPPQVFDTVLRMVRRNPNLRVFTLHDANVEGCRLPLLLREKSYWFPSPDVTVVDMGLRPLQIASMPALIAQKGDAPEQQLTSSDLVRLLSPGERHWLKTGNYGELAFFTPSRLMKAVYGMLQWTPQREGRMKSIMAGDPRGFCQTLLPGAAPLGPCGAPTPIEPEGTGAAMLLPGAADRSGTRRIGYSDRLQPDGSVERTYTNEVVETRTVQGAGRIAWSDSAGRSGVDLNLGGGRVRREPAGGAPLSGQNVGNGITCWSGGRVVTVNETDLPERLLTPPPPSGAGRLAMRLGVGKLFHAGCIRCGRRWIAPESDEYPLYAEYTMLRAFAAPGGVPGTAPPPSSTYFWIDSYGGPGVEVSPGGDPGAAVVPADAGGVDLSAAGVGGGAADAGGVDWSGAGDGGAFADAGGASWGGDGGWGGDGFG